MPSIKSVKTRIKSIKNTAQITKAMEVVSANKMRKSQEFALHARPYALSALTLLKNLSKGVTEVPLLLKKRTINRSALLIVTSDKGLAGAFNSNVLKKADLWIAEKKNIGQDFVVITVGKKAREFAERRKTTIHQSFTGFGDYKTFEEIKPIADEIIRGFLFGAWDEVDAVYTNFRTTLKQETAKAHIFPIDVAGIEAIVLSLTPEKGRFARLVSDESERAENSTESLDAAPIYYTFEPSQESILENLLPMLISMQIYHMILESNASEHSARMIAMKNASDNAKDLVTDLTRVYNTVRQAGITREIAEITAGKEALEQ